MHTTTMRSSSILGHHAEVAASEGRGFAPFDFTRTVRLVTLWAQRVRTRHQLASLDNAMLRDIGVGPRAAARESRKPFWQA